ncbi:VOC family protein [Actinocatenispora comari]|uniref:Glyoxalase n=1 Tax=Actinocatenispora comari TaxID=2807577 RepID=A0A8J4EIC1_9ACTN|nr:VOC family protein [Actinocatenispora comari]GIL25942.1 glyoxalase [Actinocatenispora comari]
MTGIARLTTIVLDCPDPRTLAAFYAELTGWPVTETDDEWVDLADDGAGVRLAFQRVDDYQPPRWPGQDRPQQFHLDLDIEPTELPAAQDKVLGLGATLAETQPGTSFRVFLDPAGHPFCLCW